MDDDRFQQELQDIKRRVNKMTLRRLARSPISEPLSVASSCHSSSDSFTAQLSDLKGHLDSMAATLSTPRVPSTQEDRFTALERRLHALEQSHYALENQVDNLQPVLTPAATIDSFDGVATGATVELDASTDCPLAKILSTRSAVGSTAAEDQAASLKRDLDMEKTASNELRRSYALALQHNTALGVKIDDLQVEVARLSQLPRRSEAQEESDVQMVKSDAFRQLVARQREIIRQDRAELAHVTADRRLRQDEIDSLRARLHQAEAAVRSKSTWIEGLYDKNKAYAAALEEEREVTRETAKARDALLEILVDRDRTIDDLMQKLEATLADRGHILRQAEARSRSDMKRLQEFCEQKDSIIHQQAEVISRGGRLMQEKDDEIDTITKKLEEERARCMEQQDKLVAALMKKDHEILQLVAQPPQSDTRLADSREESHKSLQPGVPSMNERQTEMSEKTPFIKATTAAVEGSSNARPLWIPRAMAPLRRLPQEEQRASMWNQQDQQGSWPIFGEPSLTPRRDEERNARTWLHNIDEVAEPAQDISDTSSTCVRINGKRPNELCQRTTEEQPPSSEIANSVSRQLHARLQHPEIRREPHCIPAQDTNGDRHNVMSNKRYHRLPLDYTRVPPLPMAPHKMRSETDLRMANAVHDSRSGPRAMPRHQSLQNLTATKDRDRRMLHAYVESEDEDVLGVHA